MSHRVEPDGEDLREDGAPGDERATCPICGRDRSVAMLRKSVDLDLLVARRIEGEHPEWSPNDGVCPACVQVALQALLRLDAPFALEAEMADVPPDELPELIGDLFVLPTPVRLQTWPHVTGRGVTIAFVDAGFFDHPDLVEPHDRVAVRVDARFDPPRVVERNDATDPACFHGLMTTVVAAGNGELSGGHYRGVAPNARLVLVRVGDPEEGTIGEAEIARGLAWLDENAERYGVRVVNVSLGGDYPSPSDANVVDRLVERLVERGIAVVAASGNEGRREIVPPASAPMAITVGGFDDANTVELLAAEEWQSNFGPTVDGVHKPEVVAPSVWVAAPLILGSAVHARAEAIFRLLSARDDELPGLAAEVAEALGLEPERLAGDPPSVRHAVAKLRREMKLLAAGYQHVQGTSFAAPIVTGIVAQMLELNPELGPASIKGILMATAAPLARVAREIQGAGAVRPAAALDVAARTARGVEPSLEGGPTEERDEVVFRLAADAGRVDVIGDFNGWEPGATPLAGEGEWVGRIARPAPGVYRYKFLLDGDRWIDDPQNPEREWDGYGGLVSVLRVSGAA